MAITTYSELQSAIANWLARDDLTNYIPDFITLFEATAARRMKFRLSVTSTTLTPSSGVATVPTDFFGVVRLTWTGDPATVLSYVAPSYFAARFADGSEGTPSAYTIEGTSLRVGASNDTDLTLVYNQRTQAVSGTLGWLFTKHPDAYLFGSLCEANAFNKDVDAAGLWKARRDEIFDEIMKADFNERGLMGVKVLGATP